MASSSDKPIEIPIQKRPSRYKHDINQERFRDPRFDSRCGEYKPELFVQNYQFLDLIREGELKKLKSALKKTKDTDKKEQIKDAIVKIKNKTIANNEIVKKKTVANEMKHVKKSAIKKKLLIEKFNELKDTNKLNKYIERKRKRQARPT